MEVAEPVLLTGLASLKEQQHAEGENVRVKVC